MTSTTLHAAAVLEEALDLGTFEGARRNCHVPGLDSIVLWDDREDGRGMVRYFYAHGGCPLRGIFQPSGHFVLGAHNHRYPLILEPLFGRVMQVEVVIDQGTAPMHEYAFRSGLNGKMGVEHLRKTTGYVNQVHNLVPGDRWEMDSSDLHTVAVGGEAAWIVWEGPEDPAVESRIYSPRDDLKLSSEGLYGAFSPREARSLTEYVLRMMRHG